MPKISSQTKIFLISAIAICVVTVVGYFFVVRATQASRAAYRAEITAIEGIAAQVIASESERDVLRSASDNLVRINAGFAHTDMVVDVIQAFETLGDLTGSRVEITSVHSSNAIDALGSLDMEIAIEGSWKSVLQTIRLAEEGEFFGVIDGITLQKVSPEDTEWRSKVVLSIPLTP